MKVLAILTAAATLLVWLLAGELHWAARAWLAVLMAPLPALMVLQARQLAAMEHLPRQAAYASSILSLWILAGLTAFASRLAGMQPAAMGLAPLDLPLFLAWTAGLTAAGVGVLFAFHRAGFRDAPIMEQLMPATRSERGWFVALSLTAGITEEFVFRGFLLLALHLATGSLPLAVVLGNAAFGVVHAYQTPTGAARAGLLGVLLTLPLIFEGTLLPAIAAHALIDILSGLWLARHLLR